MTKRTLILIIVGLLVVGGAAAAIASSLGGSDSQQPVHTLEGGQTHTGEMPPAQQETDEGAMMDDESKEMHDK